ncbi:YihY/virulence factor BrkB family protein [Fontivita pretiosa]|uniref:YihY/virulence factor BrkB family protein n=1 Tax=Fontivita pretiosa TaxID=2989684 RepID=UPI003D184A6E
MARLRDVPVVIRQVGLLRFIKRVWVQLGEDAVFTWGAALAYSWMFAIFPFLVLMLSLVPLIPDRFKPNIKEDVDRVVDQTLTGPAAQAVKEQAHGVLDRPTAITWAFVFGLVLTIWAASGGMAMTMSALDKAYDIDPAKARPYIKQRLVAIGLTLVVATLILLVMVLLPLGTGVLKWLSSQGKIFGWLTLLINIVRYAMAVVLLLAVLALIYHFGPSFRQRFHAITPGAVFCVAVWLMLGVAFRIYLTKLGGAESYAKTYGAVAGAAILLLFFYIDALVLLVGAEINSEIDFAVLGIPSGQTPEAQATAVTETAAEPEQQELARELLAKRSEDEPAGAVATASPDPPVDPPDPEAQRNQQRRG